MLTDLQSETVYEERLNELRYAFNKVCALNHVDTDFICICKSNIVLMMYNLIESTVVNTMKEYYCHMFKNPDYAKKNKKTIDIWVDSIMNSSFGTSRSFNDYKETAHSLITKYCNNEIKADYHKYDSGNLDAKSIQKMCDTHNITLIKCQRFSDVDVTNQLLNIKRIRNKLAHGEQSFVETGRDISENDLADNIDLVAEYLQCFLKTIDAHIKRAIPKQT